MDYLPGQYGMHYERIGLNDYHFDSLGLAGHRPYYAFAGNQLATGEQGSNGNYYWMQQQHSGQHLMGQKQYELTNHLGNVQVTVSDLPYKHGDDTMTHISPALKAVYDYYPFGSPMPGRTVMDTARKCVDMTRLDRVWKAWEMTQVEIYTLSLINYHLDGEGKVFIDDNGAVEVETADEHAVFYMELQDSLNNGGEMVLYVDWLKEFSEKGFLLTLQGMDATGEMRVFYQKHYEKPEDALYLNIADSFTNVSVGIQGNLHIGISNIRYYGGSWVNEEVLVRVCDEGGDRYRFGFNGQEKVNEIAGMGNHNTAEFWEYDTRLGRRWNVDPKTNESISTYATFAGNPNLFVDPLGDTVWIYKYFHKPSHGYNYLQTHKVEYRDKWLFSEDGVRLKAISDPYLIEVLTTLNNLQDISIEARQRLEDMKKDKAPHIISNMDLDSKIEEKMKGRGNYNRSIIENDPSKGTITRWNKKDVSINYTPEASLAHEILSHGYNRANNKFRNKQVINNLGIKFSEDEWDAINLSNQILYNQKIKFNKKLKLIKDYSGVPIPESEFKQPKENDIPN